MSEGLSTLDHIKPISNEFGIRGRMPRYRLGRYGPHSNDALFDVDGPSDVFGNASTKAQKMSRVSGNMTRYSQPWVCFNPSTAVARDATFYCTAQVSSFSLFSAYVSSSSSHYCIMNEAKNIEYMAFQCINKPIGTRI